MAKKKRAAKKKSVQPMRVTIDIEKAIVDKFLEKMEQACLRASTRQRTVAQATRPDMLKENTKYWKHARKALQWARKINSQRSK